ncbi:hypothetical protein JXI42_05480 [bacterium]|nr:hypothetical protein [bacterium]
MKNRKNIFLLLALFQFIAFISCAKKVGPLELVGKWQLGTQTFMEFYYLDHSIPEDELKSLVKEIGLRLKKNNAGLQEVGVLVLYDKDIAALASSNKMMNSVLQAGIFKHNQFFKHPDSKVWGGVYLSLERGKSRSTWEIMERTERGE